jgi:outer membrane cobalamin receptor
MRIFVVAAALCLCAGAARAEPAGEPDTNADIATSQTDDAQPADRAADAAAQPDASEESAAGQPDAAQSTDRTAGADADQAGGPTPPDQSAAQTPPAPQPTDAGVYKLGEVVVLGDPNIDAPGQSVDRIDAQTIEDKNARTLDEALQQLPGVDIRLRKEGVPRLDIRGLPPRHVPLFLNGVPINAASDGQFDPSLIPSENIAQINVIRGTSSVLYGPGALGGVVDIITKKGSSPATGALSGEYGSGNSRLARGSVSGAEGQFDGFLSGSRFQANGYPVPDEDLRNNSDKTRTNLFFNGGYTPNDQWSFGFNFGYLKGEQGVPPSTVSAASSIFASNPKFERLDAIDGKSGEMDVRYAATNMLDFRFTGYFNQFDVEDNIYDNANYNSMSNPKVKSQHVQNNDFVTGGQMQSNLDFGEAGLFTLGLIGKSENATSEGQIRDVPAGGGNFNFRSVVTDDTVQTFTAGLQYAVAPTARTRLVMGIAEDWFVQPGHETRDATQAMASVTYRILDDLRLNTAISQDVRFPSTQELFDPTQGNRNLEPEIGFNLQGGFNWTLPNRDNIDLTGFRNKVNGFIQNDKTTNVFGNNNVLLRGVEIAYRAVVFERLAFRAAYSYLDTTIEQTNGFSGSLDLRPKHKVDFQGIYTFADEWKAYLATTYLADQTISSRTSPVQQETLANYATVDMKLSRSFLHDQLSVYVGADNLFNQKADIGPGFPLPGRFIFGGISTHI